MNRKKAISILAIIMAVVMMLSLVLSVLPTAFAISQSDIDALRQKKEEIAARAKDAEELIGSLEEEQGSVLVQKAALDAQNAAALEELELIQQELDMYDQMIADKTEELKAAQAVEDQQLTRYRTRVRAMEENGRYNVLALFFRADSYADLLAALDDMNEIMESDKELEHQYRAARQEHERVKAEYEELYTECETQQAELRKEQHSIQKQIDETNAHLEQLADQISAAYVQFESERDAEAAAAQELTNMLAAYDAQKRAEAAARAAAAAEAARIAAEQAAQQSSGSNVSSVDPGTGETAAPQIPDAVDDPGDPNTPITDDPQPADQVPDAQQEPQQQETPAEVPQQQEEPQQQAFTGFMWPVPCSSRITGRFGESRPGHFHAGIDIDGFGNDGSAIVAAASGTVITAGYGSAYGNYVIIDHGNEYKTVYAHLGSISVSEGSTVYQGQQIGTLGATGNASGTHCHFEVRLHHSTIDPTQFFSGYTFYDL